MARPRLLLIGLGVALGAGVLLTVFALYTDADFMRLMADQLWACF